MSRLQLRAQRSSPVSSATHAVSTPAPHHSDNPRDPGLRRVALASASGTTVDQHFATAVRFLIYDLNAGQWSLVEERENSNSQCGCSAPSGCDKTVFSAVLSLLSDVDLVVVTRIGADAAAALLDRGIRGHLASGGIEAVLSELRNSPKLKFPLKRKGPTV